jgi:hypothetical protein
MSRISKLNAVAMCGCLVACAAAYGQATRTVISSGTVVTVKTLDSLSSKDARTGDRVRVQVADDDRSGLPPGTVLAGRNSKVQQATRSQPGTIDMDFRVAELGGRWIGISGDPYSLHDNDVEKTASGRLVAKSGQNNRMKFIGYGAVGGVVLGRLLGTSALKGALLGAAAGYLYDRSQGAKDKYHDVALDKGAQFGVRLNRDVELRQSDFASASTSRN